MSSGYADLYHIKTFFCIVTGFTVIERSVNKV